MAMSVTVHAHSKGGTFETRGYVTESYGEAYAVIGIQSGSGANSEDVALLLTEEQLNNLKKMLQSTSIEFKRHNAKKVNA